MARVKYFGRVLLGFLQPLFGCRRYFTWVLVLLQCVTDQGLPMCGVLINVMVASWCSSAV